MDRTTDGSLACPYCGQPLHWVSLRWFGRGCFECDRCGEFPDLGDPVDRTRSIPPRTALGPVHIPQKQPDRPRVLLVDDSDEHRDLYALMLEPTATVVTASRGEHALEIARAEPLDAIILDVLMPGMDGWAVAERLKANALTSSIPVILLTSLDGLDVPDRAHRVGAAAVIMKPCPVERLALAIQAAVQARQTGIVRGNAFTRTRRWTRKAVRIAVPAQIGTTPGKLVNVSYGGLCVEFDSTPRGLVSPLEVTFPGSPVAVSAGLIWLVRGDHSCVCGAEVSSVSTEWRGLVDLVG